MRHQHVRVVVALAILAVTTSASAAEQLRVCSRINAKQMPTGFEVEAMKFTGPAGDGRRGSAGFVVQTRDLLKGSGARLSFEYQRAASGFGFQVIHPLGEGHVLVSVHSRGVALHRGGSWGDIGWGDPSSSEPLEVNADAKRVLKLEAGVTYRVTSELAPTGEYQLTMNDVLVCRHRVKQSKPLVLNVPKESRVWGGSSWNRTPFAGEGFDAKLKPGHAGLILGPMDGSGPTQNLQDVRLASTSPSPHGKANTRQTLADSADYAPLFRRIDNAREFGKLVKSKVAGGGGGGAFESTNKEPTLLVGFEYTLSTFYGGHLTVKSLRPIYQTPSGETVGAWRGAPHGTVHRVRAKRGYVVTALVAKHGHRIDGMRLLFMRVRGGGLNPDDTYRSNWIGGHGGGGERLYGAYGEPTVSIFGRQGRDIDAIGFLQLKTD